MNDTPSTLSIIRRPAVLVTVGIALLVVIVWFLAFFLPQGSKLSSLQSKEQTLQQEVTNGNAKVARLKHTFQREPQLEATTASLHAAVPATTDVYNYVTALSGAASSAGVHLTSVGRSASAALPSGNSGIATIPVTMTVKGTYDQILSLIKNVYALPRLTVIQGLVISGGGPKTTRATALDATLNLEAFSTGKQAPLNP